ncbi:histidine phosphatase family protein [Salinigranum rubrum]|uniref:Histidine phosphatase family protein n=1 Tax=Salinigranum rubrum TaxID=755307 RepID=A0A2I8VNM4_9EURY|nr:histidine phosphatase family protein [Salinigranum rubrum]AUV83521.1 histidine phosphatase family protein [Salinigranum rubrum]
MATALLVRHGETTWNRSGRIQGWAPTPLTDRGREQAAALGAHLASTVDVDSLVSSDLRRAQETARHVARETGSELTTDAAWRERDFGCLQGFSSGEVFEEFPEYALSVSGAAAATARPDSGETLVEVRDRVLDGWERLLADLSPDETVVIVAHGGPNRLLLGSLLRYDVVDSILELDQDNCALNEIRASEPRVVRRNDTRYLPDDLTVDSETVA